MGHFFREKWMRRFHWLLQRQCGSREAWVWINTARWGTKRRADEQLRQIRRCPGVDTLGDKKTSWRVEHSKPLYGLQDHFAPQALGDKKTSRRLGCAECPGTKIAGEESKTNGQSFPTEWWITMDTLQRRYSPEPG